MGEPIHRLLKEIQAEEEFIQSTLSVLGELPSDRKLTRVELAATGSFLHDIYTGIENLIKRTLVFLEKPLPHTTSSHRDLLDMAVSHGFIQEDLRQNLDVFRAFRHFFRYGYGINLDETKLRPLISTIPELWKRFHDALLDFVHAQGNP